MAGMLVTVNFLDGGQDTETWRTTDLSTCGYSDRGHPYGHKGGEASGNGWSLSESGDTYNGYYWSFQNNNNSRPIRSLTINAIPGNTVFDAIAYNPNADPNKFNEITPGSADGWPFTVSSGQAPDGYPFYTTSHTYPNITLPLPDPTPYSVPIDISRGDLFGDLSLSWSSGFTGNLRFGADTDSGTASDPVKSAAPPPPPNIPPTLTLPNYTVYEGQPATITLSATDPSPDPINFLLNGNSIGTDGNTSGTRTASIGVSPSQYDTPGVYPLIGQAVNSQGGASNVVNGTLTVLNVPPTITDFALNGSNSDITIPEGQSVAATLAATDPGLSEPITFFINSNNEGTDPTSARTISTNLGTFNKYGTYTYTAAATDSYNAYSAPVTRTVTVENVPPTLTAFNLASDTINEGDPAYANLSATDPGADAITFLINGTSIGTDPALSGSRSMGTKLGVFNTPGTYTFQAQAEDDGSAFSNIIQKTLTVKDVPPTITSLTTPLKVPTGSIFDFAATATDSGNLPLSYDWDFSNNGLFDDLTGQSGKWSFGRDGIYDIGLKVADGYGGVTYRYFQIESVPEPSSIFGVLAFGALGAGSVLKRKQQQNKQA